MKRLSLAVPFEEPVPVAANVPIQANTTPIRICENVPKGALLDVIVRCDSSTATAYVLFGSGNSPTAKVVASDGNVRVRFITTETTSVVGDGTTTPTFRILGYALGGTQVE